METKNNKKKVLEPQLYKYLKEQNIGVEKKEKTIEIKFNSKKEKIFIFLKENTTLKVIDELLKLFKLQNENKIYLLPENFVSSVKVIKDIKDRKVEKFIRFLKKDIAKLSGMKIKKLFGIKRKRK